jgi:hypothetical protein
LVRELTIRFHTHIRRLTNHPANVRVIHAVCDGGILPVRGYSAPEIIVGLSVGGRYYAAVVSSFHRDHGRNKLAMTIQAKDCQSDIEALVKLYEVSLSLLNDVRELCEKLGGEFC